MWMGVMVIALIAVGLVVYSCMVVSGRISKAEEEREWMRREMEDSSRF